MGCERHVRLMIVDDSAVMRSLLRTVVAADPCFEIAATASDGASALAAISTARPDLILLDVEMPVMDGLVTLRKLRAAGHKMPVVMCSSLTQRGGKVTIEALASGATDYVAKPSGQSNREAATEALRRELIPKIRALTAPAAPAMPPPLLFPGGPPSATARSPLSPPGAVAPGVAAVKPRLSNAPPTVLAIGVSTGGPAALDVLLPALPANFPIPILVVQHMPELFTKLLADRLDSRCPLKVSEGSEGEPVRPGNVYIARGNWHMEVAAAARGGAQTSIRLQQNPPENHCRPAVDVLFRSVAAAYGAGALAVVLTGMGSDGLAGGRVIQAQGGLILAQDQATSTVWGMPGAVANAGLASKILPLNAIAPEILRIVSRPSIEARELRESVV